jgi:transposase
VDHFFQKLGFDAVFTPLKARGHDITTLVSALVGCKLAESVSISRAADWMNAPSIREWYGLAPVHRQTLYLALERLGQNADTVMAGVQDAIFSTYDFPKTDVNLDWTSVVLHGEAAELGRYGYSRDHRPDKRQLTLGVSELASPVNIPVGMTVREGNLNDQAHFADTYGQVRRLLKDGSLVVFDKGASSQKNKELVRASGMHYLSSKKLNMADDKRIATFWKDEPELVDRDKRVYGLTFVKPRSIDYLYYSATLYERQMESVRRRAHAMLLDARELQDAIDADRRPKKKYRCGPGGNCLITSVAKYQTLLSEMTDDEAYRYALSRCANGREGFFCLKSSVMLTLAEALATYRKKDSIEKIFHSLKNEIEVKPVRCWKKERQIGVLLIGFLAQLFVSLLRYDLRELANTSTKFIKKSLRNLTETLVRGESGAKKRIFSNFDGMNKAILRNCGAIS